MASPLVHPRPPRALLAGLLALGVATAGPPAFAADGSAPAPADRPTAAPGADADAADAAPLPATVTDSDVAPADGAVLVISLDATADAPAEGARALVDGSPVPLDKPLLVAPGEHTAKVIAGDRCPKFETVTAEAGQTYRLKLRPDSGPRPQLIFKRGEPRIRLHVEGGWAVWNKPIDVPRCEGSLFWRGVQGIRTTEGKVPLAPGQTETIVVDFAAEDARKAAIDSLKRLRGGQTLRLSLGPAVLLPDVEPRLLGIYRLGYERVTAGWLRWGGGLEWGHGADNARHIAGTLRVAAQWTHLGSGLDARPVIVLLDRPVVPWVDAQLGLGWRKLWRPGGDRRAVFGGVSDALAFNVGVGGTWAFAERWGLDGSMRYDFTLGQTLRLVVGLSFVF
jgi:hypothetical protein